MKRPNMRRIIGGSLLALGLATLGSTSPAGAQDYSQSGTPAATRNDRDNGRDMDWGWLGLFGLAGLAGLRRRSEHVEPARQRSVAQ